MARSINRMNPLVPVFICGSWRFPLLFTYSTVLLFSGRAERPPCLFPRKEGPPNAPQKKSENSLESAPKNNFLVACHGQADRRRRVASVKILIFALPSRFHEISKKRRRKTNPYMVFRGTPRFHVFPGTCFTFYFTGSRVL